MLLAMTNIAFGDTDNILHVSIKAESTAGGLDVVHPQLPDNVLAYQSCEAVLFGEPTDSTPLFEVQLSETPRKNGACWQETDNTFSYEWTYDQGFKVAFTATPASNCLRLRYTLTNVSDTPRKRVMLHICIPTTEAPAFFSDFVESPVHDLNQTGNYMGFYNRTFLWSEGKSFSIGKTEKGKEEVHLSFTRAGQPHVKWAWWNDGPETFDFPFIAVQSTDGKFTTALGFEEAEWASCNGGDDRACFHLFPLFGDLEPGESATVDGGFYLMCGTPEDALRQFKKDLSL